MAVSVYSRHDIDVLFGEQATWGTPLVGTSAFTYADMQSSVIDPGYNQHVSDRSHMSRVTRDTNTQNDTSGTSPKIQLSGDAKLLTISDFLYAHMQNVTETAVTFVKTFTTPTTQPDFTAGAGYLMSIAEQNPVASTDKIFGDGVCPDLLLKCSPGGRLQMTADIVGRGTVDESTTLSGTLSRPAQTFFYFEDITACTANGNAVHPIDWEAKFSWVGWKGVGVDTGDTGKFLTYAIPEYSCEMAFTVLWDANARAIQDLRGTNDGTTGAAINHPWVIAWGTSGQTGYFSFTMQGQVMEAVTVPGEANAVKFKVKMVDDGTTEPLTVVLDDNNERSW